MTPAHQDAARRLAALTGDERDWVLARLSSDDALRIRELMEPGSAPVAAEPPPRPAPAEAESTPERVLEQAAADDVAKLLLGEPDWLIALVLAKRRWPWDRELLAALHPARVDELSVLAWRAAETAKPRACEAAIAMLAARLREAAAPVPQALSAFDELVARMT
ncbi:MAG: hypothetical protein ACJ8G4_15170 [Burkholderiales bacterium]